MEKVTDLLINCDDGQQAHIVLLKYFNFPAYCQPGKYSGNDKRPFCPMHLNGPQSEKQEKAEHIHL